jgi:hypothetical protein
VGVLEVYLKMGLQLLPRLAVMPSLTGLILVCKFSLKVLLLINNKRPSFQFYARLGGLEVALVRSLNRLGFVVVWMLNVLLRRVQLLASYLVEASVVAYTRGK